ncbi:MAG: hypothetical protein IJU23_03870 [Proteobacteria bacterium]|nr:hypothetical protein [Pseudomonadota bacterium]
MRSESSISHRFKVDLIILAVVIVFGILAALHHFPIKFSSHDEPASAMMPKQFGQAGILLVLPDQPENAQNYQSMNFAFAWYNFLSQYAGPFSIILCRDVQSAAILQAQVIVVPQRSAELLSETQIQLIGQAVQKGATLVIEMPTPEWSALTAIKRRNKVNSAIRHFTDAPNSPLTGAWRDHLLNSPLDTQVMRVDALESEVLPSDAMLLEMDGAIVHYRRAVGAGFVFVLAFNFGQAMTSIQQGRPGDEFEIHSDQPPRPADLVLNEKLLSNTVPYADLLKMHILASVLYTSPMPVVWPFPDGGRSALILAHETGKLGDDAFEAANFEQSQNVSSTWLTTAGNVSRKTLERWKGAGFDIGVSLLRPPAGRVYEPYGPSFFQPVAVERNMTNQRLAVSKRSGAAVSTCKMADSNWTHDYTMGFRRLAAAQCQIDMSYGPVDPEQYGYLFGSGYPFLPLERNGLPLPTYEFPSLVSDQAGLNTIPPHTALKLLTESESTFHEPVVVTLQADKMLSKPTYASPETWLEVIHYARENHIWTTSAKAFMYHYTKRKEAQITHAFHPQTKVLDIRANMPSAKIAYTLALPRRTIHGTLHDIWVDKQPVDLTTIKSTGDGLLMLVPVPPGEHLVQGQYN